MVAGLASDQEEHSMSDRHLQARAITCPIVRLDSGSSRGFACIAPLRPRCATADALDEPSVEPGPWQLRDGPEVHGHSHIGTRFNT
jgi:hypothetical protein